FSPRDIIFESIKCKPIRRTERPYFQKLFRMLQSAVSRDQSTHRTSDKRVELRLRTRAIIRIDVRLERARYKFHVRRAFSAGRIFSITPRRIFVETFRPTVIDSYDDGAVIALLKEFVEGFIHAPFARKGSLGIKQILPVVHVKYGITF